MANDNPCRKVLYHHRTQGKAVEGVHIRGIADALRAEGIEVDIVSLPGADPYSTPPAMSPTQQANRLMKLVSRLPQPVFEIAELGYNLVSALRLVSRLVGAGRPDFVYERYSLFLFSTIVLARLLKIPVFLEINDSAGVHRVRPLHFRSIAMAIERWCFKNATGLIFVSSAFMNRAREMHGSTAPCIVTPNAANVSQFSVSSECRAEARERLQVQDAVVCGYLGAFVPWHAIDKFVYGIAPRLNEVPQLKLLLIGDGATYSQVASYVLEHELSSRIVLTGRVAHAEVPGLLAAVDFAILPSAGDYTSPVKLFEFMASGIPALAPDFEPIREVLRPDDTGWLFPADDIAAAVERALALAKNRAALSATGVRARAYIAAERQWVNNVRQLLEFYAREAGRRC
jgi:glycosyltransferase involved in cell wall biosynthesis